MADFTNETLPPNPVFDGDDAVNTVAIVSDDPPVDLSTATFQNWVSGADFIIISGASQTTSLSITGSSENDVIIGGLAADVIDGGAGDDLILYDGNDVSIAGGDDTDTLKLNGAATIDLSAPDQSVGDTAVVTGFENVDASDSSAAVDVTGDAGVNVLTGGDGGDTLEGGGDDDDIDGGAGDDTINYTVGDGTDTIEGGTHTVGDTLAVTGTAGDDTIDVVVSGGLITTIEEMTPSGIEMFTLDALGEDTLGDTLSYAGTTESVEVDLSSPSATGFASIAGIENVTGGSGDDTLTGDAGVNVLTGGDGGDTLEGGGDDDDIDGGAGDDTIVGFVGADMVDGGDDDDTLVLDATSTDLNVAADGNLIRVETVSAAGAGSGVVIDLHGQTEGFEIIGSAHDDTITGSTGADDIDAGAGNDTIVGFGAGDVVDGGANYDTLILAATSAALNNAANGAFVNVEAVSAAGAIAGVVLDLGKQSDGFDIAGSAQADTIIGSTGADDIDAGAGNDTIVGFIGADSVDGGANTDTLTLAATSAALNAASDGNLVNVEIVSAAAALIGVVLNLGNQSDGFAIIGSSQGDTVTGSTGADVINAGSGNDTVIANSGNDVVDGGAGNDVMTGSAGVDVLFGGLGNDTIRATAGDGNDFYDGGTGIDTVDYSATGGGLKIDLTAENRSGQSVGGDPGSFAALLAAGGIGNANTAVGFANGGATGIDVLIGIENAIGGQGADTIFGSDTTNFLDGSGGNDRIWGRGADDVVRGGAGNDLLVGGFGGDSTKASGNDILFGDDGNDELYGEDGDDVLTGGKGSDQYAGGDGDDLLVFDADGTGDSSWGGKGSDTFQFHAGFGKDRIKDLLATGKNSDRIDLSQIKGAKFSKLKIVQKGNDVEIKSKAFKNGDKIILEVVNAGALTEKDFVFTSIDRIKGGNKNDKLSGSARDDRIDGRKGHDKLKGKDGDDTLLGRGGKDKLIGGDGDDVLKGHGGKDKLLGGPGDDTLTGGSKADVFVFKSAADGFDTITDFVSGSDWLKIKAQGFGGGLVSKGAATLVSLADISGYVDMGSKGIFLHDNAGPGQGTVYWDPNGGSSGDAIAVFTVGSAAITAADFHIV